MTTHDAPSLILARAILRNAYRELGALPQVDPTIRCLREDLVIWANDLTVEIESEQPELDLPKVVRRIEIGTRP